MNIDWDGVAQEADNSPRSILGEAISLADEMVDVIVVYRRKDDSIGYAGCDMSDRLKAFGLLEVGKLAIWDDMQAEDS